MKTNHSSLPLSLRFALGFLVASLPALSARADDAAVNSSDKSFIQDAYQDGAAEIQLGELGLKKTANPEVKAFSERLITDHTKANGQLKSLADSKKVSVDPAPGLMATGKIKMLDMKSGSDFDKAFVDDLVDNHKKDIEAFEKTANQAGDGDVKNFAAQTLPTLKEHLSEAETIQGKIGK